MIGSAVLRLVCRFSFDIEIEYVEKKKKKRYNVISDREKKRSMQSINLLPGTNFSPYLHIHTHTHCQTLIVKNLFNARSSLFHFIYCIWVQLNARVHTSILHTLVVITLNVSAREKKMNEKREKIKCWTELRCNVKSKQCMNRMVDPFNGIEGIKKQVKSLQNFTRTSKERERKDLSRKLSKWKETCVRTCAYLCSWSIRKRWSTGEKGGGQFFHGVDWL